MTLPIFTIGHSTRAISDFVELLGFAEVRRVVDVRSIPRSRTNPQYNADVLPATLAQFAIGYDHIAALGGRRGKSRDVPSSVNAFWINQSFHNYADYAMTPDFGLGLGALFRLSREERCAIMCSEAVWWRCHRRIIADYLMNEGESVVHILGPNHLEPASLTSAAKRTPHGLLAYPAEV